MLHRAGLCTEPLRAEVGDAECNLSEAEYQKTDSSA